MATRHFLNVSNFMNRRSFLRTLEFDPATRSFKNDKDANKYITRPEYRKPWVLPKIDEV
jgi:hypothetical protein